MIPVTKLNEWLGQYGLSTEKAKRISEFLVDKINEYKEEKKTIIRREQSEVVSNRVGKEG